MDKIELVCIKSFHKCDIVNFQEGNIYIGIIDIDLEDGVKFFVVYPHNVDVPNGSFYYQIFNFEKGFGIPCIADYFLTKGELREQQIKTVIDVD